MEHPLGSINLQMFSQEKTEKATPKRRQESRKKGQVAKSNEVNSALVLLSTFSMILVMMPTIAQQMRQFLVLFLTVSSSQEITSTNIHRLTIEVVVFILKIILPILLTAAVTGFVANVSQVGFMVSEGALTIKLERLNPLEGFKRIFSKRSLVELFKSIVKIGSVGFIAYTTIKKSLYWFAGSLTESPIVAVIVLKDLIWSLLLQTGGILLVLAGLDYFYQRWEFEQGIKMSKHDIKEEYKQTEGDPKIKSKIKELQRQMATRRMMQEIPNADVIITNPTHYAIAIQYDGDKMDAPFVIAKGQDLIAQEIKRIAEQHGVPKVENKPLAQALYKAVEIGQSVPPELYQAVAEVLAFIYRLKGKV